MQKKKKKSTEVYLNRVTRRNNHGVLKIQRKNKPQQKPRQLLPCQKTILAGSIHGILLTNQADANLTSQCYLHT